MSAPGSSVETIGLAALNVASVGHRLVVDSWVDKTLGRWRAGQWGVATVTMCRVATLISAVASGAPASALEKGTVLVLSPQRAVAYRYAAEQAHEPDRHSSLLRNFTVRPVMLVPLASAEWATIDEVQILRLGSREAS